MYGYDTRILPLPKSVEEILIYLRKSRADNPLESVEEVVAKHERDLQDMAIKMFGKRIPEKNIFREIVSGETISERPIIQKVLKMIESDKYRGVMVVDPERLSRGDWEDGGIILKAFKWSYTLILTPQKIFNLQDENDYKLFKMSLSRGNEYLEYYKFINQRGRLRSVNDGNYIGNFAPFGYDKVKLEDGSHSLKPNENAKYVQLIFDLYVNKNLGWKSICLHLEEIGVKPLRSEYWSPVTIRDMIANPVYIGKIRWNWRKEVNVYENGKVKKTRPRQKEYILVDGKHEAIVSEELFNAAAEKNGRNSKEHTFTELKNPFASLIVCGSCGKNMVYRTYSNKGVERCKPRLLCNNQSRCKTKSIVYDEFLEEFINAIKGYVEDFEIRIKNDESESVHGIYEKVVEDLEKQLQEIEERQEKLYDLLESKIYTPEVFAERNKKLDQNRQALKEQLKNAIAAIPEKINYEEKLYTFKQVLQTLQDENIKAKHKNDLLKSFIDKIVYHNNKSDKNDRFASNMKLEIFLK